MVCTWISSEPDEAVLDAEHFVVFVLALEHGRNALAVRDRAGLPRVVLKFWNVGLPTSFISDSFHVKSMTTRSVDVGDGQRHRPR